MNETDPPLCSWARVLWGALGCQSMGCCDAVGKVLSRWGAQPGLSSRGAWGRGGGSRAQGPSSQRGGVCQGPGAGACGEGQGGWCRVRLAQAWDRKEVGTLQA